MRYLLDTNVLLWFLEDNSELAETIQLLFTDRHIATYFES
jgi:PIN domain nuclease of toxin-antitoxin system